MFGPRRASTQDIPQIWELRSLAIQAGCREHYSDDEIRRWALLPVYEGFAAVVADTEFLVMADAARITAFGNLDVSKSEIGAMFVHPDFQGLGFGRRILATLEGIAAQSGVSTLSLVATLNAEHFYSAAGFQAQPRAKWKHPAGFELDCVPMSKILKSSTPAD